MPNIAIIGCGYWGPNLLRNFAEQPDCEVTFVADLDSERLKYVQKKYPSIQTTSDYHDLFCDQVDAIVLASPVSTHYALAKEAMLAGKHVLVEKPLAQSTQEAEELVNLAHEKNLILMAGHTFLYNEAVRELKRQMQAGAVGQPYYFYSQRLNFGIVRKDVNALWNLAPHDISIFNYLMEDLPESVSCRGYDFIQPGVPDVVFLVLHYPNNVVAHIHVSWLDPSKMRKITVVGSEKMIVYNDMDDYKIQIFDKGIKIQNMDDSLGEFDTFGKYQLIKQAGDVVFPKINFKEPLQEECAEFINCINEIRQPLTSGQNGLDVVRVLETAQSSLDLNGVALELKKSKTVATAEKIISSSAYTPKQAE